MQEATRIKIEFSNLASMLNVLNVNTHLFVCDHEQNWSALSKLSMTPIYFNETETRHC